MKILGIDPGLAFSGWAIIEDKKIVSYGTIKTKKWKDKAKTGEYTARERIDLISENISQIVFKFKPEAVALEDFVYFGNVGKVSSNMSALIENLRVKFKDKNIPIKIYTSGQWKKILLRNYRANKKQVEHYIKRTVKINFNDKGGHVYDAIGIALTYDKNLKGVKK